MDFWFKTT